MPSNYEQERAERIAVNAKKIEELGIKARVAAMNARVLKPKSPKKHTARVKIYEMDVPIGEARRSGRLQGREALNYNEDVLGGRGIDRLELLPRRRRVNVDPSKLEGLREAARERAGEAKGPQDSGLGVRIQGGRVYDSKYGVTCHWCRQKTLEEHVTCTHPGCGDGRKLPVAFCKMCLSNRHGEDLARAEASGKWVCPACRGSCGDGCTTCCNCGPCRKSAGLGPTFQLIKQARESGFGNVHDYLVHQKTGEPQDIIAARKETFPWGAWSDVPFCADPATPSAVDAAGPRVSTSEGAAAGPSDSAAGQAHSPGSSPRGTGANQQRDASAQAGNGAAVAAHIVDVPNNVTSPRAAVPAPNVARRTTRASATTINSFFSAAKAPHAAKGKVGGTADKTKLPIIAEDTGKVTPVVVGRKARMMRSLGLAPVN